MQNQTILVVLLGVLCWALYRYHKRMTRCCDHCSKPVKRFKRMYQRDDMPHVGADIGCGTLSFALRLRSTAVAHVTCTISRMCINPKCPHCKEELEERTYTNEFNAIELWWRRMKGEKIL